MKNGIFLLAGLKFFMTLNAVTAGECDSILEKGVRDELHLESSEMYHQQVREVMNMTFDDVVAESHKSSSRGKIAYGVLNASGGTGNQQDGFQRFKQNFNEQKNNFFSSEQFTAINSSTVNGSVVQAWEDCMSGKNILSYYSGDQSRTFTITIRYVLRREEDPLTAEVTDSSYTNLKPVGEWKFNTGHTVGKFAWITQPMQRIDDTEPATFSVSFGGKGIAQFTFPANLATPAPESPFTLKPVPNLIDFDGDGIPDAYSLYGTSMIVHMSRGDRDVVVARDIPNYNAALGFWLAGDFNGDGYTDLIHIVPQHCHVHFSDKKGGFLPPTTFDFPSHANPQHDYNAALGHWSARDLNGDGKCDLEHNPDLPDHRIHYWLSNGDGTFTLK